MHKILVTGGAGFIGSNLVDRLIDEGYEVIVVDNLSSGREDYLHPQATFHKLDISADDLDEIFTRERFDYVYHLAAQIDVRHSVANPVFDNSVNVLGGFSILKKVHKNGVKKIIFVSTGGALYGDTENIPTTEEEPTYPLSPYGIHKLAFEKYLHYYHKVHGQDYLILRLANVYGPRQYKGGEAGVIANFVESAVNKTPCVLNGDGLQTRDFVYVGDVVEALVKAKESDYVGEMNISTAKEVNLHDVIAAIEKTIGEKFSYQQMPGKLGEQRRSCLSHQKAKEILGYEPKVDLEEGIRRTIEWAKNYKKNLDSLNNS